MKPVLLFSWEKPLYSVIEKTSAEVSHIAHTAPVRQQTNAGYCVTVSSAPEKLHFFSLNDIQGFLWDFLVLSQESRRISPDTRRLFLSIQLYFLPAELSSWPLYQRLSPVCDSSTPNRILTACCNSGLWRYARMTFRSWALNLSSESDT